MKRIISMVLVLAWACTSWAAVNLSGRVVDAATGETVPFAGVRINNPAMALVADSDGCFSFDLPRPATVTLTASMVGFSPATVSLKVPSGGLDGVTVRLSEDVELMDDLVVSANRNAVSRREAPVVVNVLNHKLFETVTAPDLAQTLNYQSGLRVENNCQNCGFPQVRINGLEGPYSQVLINSRPVVSSLSGVYALEQMPVNMIERVEVVRGGGSALFGANAVGGTINVITRDPVNNLYDFGTTVSNMDGKAWEENFNANAALVDADSRYGMALYETFRHRAPYDRDGDGFSEVGKIKLNTFGINTFYRFNPYARLGVEYHNTSEFRRGGNKFNLEPFQTDITEQTRHLINSGGLNFTRSWRDYTRRLNVYASVQHIGRDSYYGALQNPDAYGRTTDMTWVTGATFAGDFDKVLFSPATFTAGLEYQSNRLHDIMTGYGRDMRQSVNIFGMFVQNEWRWRRFTLLGGLRMDVHNLIDNPILSPRINILYRPVDNLQTRLTWSTGFRAPQAYDEDLHVTAVGGEGVLIKLAPGLRPERSNSFSGSADWELRVGNVDVDLLLEGFFTELNHVFVLDMVGVDDDGNTVKMRRNGNGARVYGANADIKCSLGSRHSLQLGFTAQRSLYKQPEQWSEDPGAEATRRMPRTPSVYGYFTLNCGLARRLDLSLSGVYTGRMWVPHYAPDHSEIPDGYPYGYIGHDELVHTPQFMDVNLKVTYDVPLSGRLTMQVGAGVQNVLNSFQRDLDRGAYRDSGYFYGPTQPRTYFASVRFFTR